MAVQTLQQQRMAYSLEQVQHYADELNRSQQPETWKTNRKKFKARASELPFMIHANGLGQALAFFRSKNRKDGYDYLFDILSGWLIQDGRPLAGEQDALVGVTQCSRNDYMMAQAEAILLMDWVKMFAAAFMDVAEGDVP